MPVRSVSIPFHVDEQIAEALVYTLGRFGPRKHAEYCQMIEDALDSLRAEAESGDRRPDIDPEAWLYPLTRSRHGARHVFLYRIRGDDVLVEAFRYDGMDMPAHWPRKG